MNPKERKAELYALKVLSEKKLTLPQLAAIRKLLTPQDRAALTYSKRTTEAILQGRRNNAQILLKAVKAARKRLNELNQAMQAVDELLSSDITTPTPEPPQEESSKITTLLQAENEQSSIDTTPKRPSIVNIIEPKKRDKTE